ncbi:GIY-YIG nuclease family protein [Aerococcaceae bacterium 50-4]
MTKFGKNINLFLLDGSANGPMKATMANWTGIVYKIPRVDVERSSDRKDLEQSGVYLLFGVSEKNDEPVVYIGQAGARNTGTGLLNRLKEHKRNPDKDYWTEAIAITTTNNSFGPTEISYLENQFTQMAKLANRFEVQNGNTPTKGNLTEEKKSEMEEFISYCKVILAALGHKVFEPVAEEKTTQNSNVFDENLHLFLQRKDLITGFIAKGKGKQTSSGFVVLKGSMINPNESVNVPASIVQRRKSANINDERILQEDILFSSPSYAATFVIGKSSNGLIEWKNLEGKSLKFIESEWENVSEKPNWLT